MTSVAKQSTNRLTKTKSSTNYRADAESVTEVDTFTSRLGSNNRIISEVLTNCETTVCDMLGRVFGYYQDEPVATKAEQVASISDDILSSQSYLIYRLQELENSLLRLQVRL